MATPKEPANKSPRSNANAPYFDSILHMAAQSRFVLFPALHGPEQIERLIKSNAVVDMAIVVAQSSPSALDTAEEIAKELTVSCGGHYEVHTYTGQNGRMAHPIIITYLSRKA
jgi:hypothetical protein